MVVRGSSSKPLKPSATERFDDASTPDGKDARALTDGAHGALEIDHAYSSSPSGVDPSASLPGNSLDFDGRDVGASYTSASEGSSTSVAGGIATGEGWTGVTVAGEGRSVDVGVSFEKGWLGGSGGVAWATLDGGARGVSGGAAWYPGGIALDGSFAHTTSEGRTLRVGAIGFFDADRAVQDLGPAADDVNKRRIELRRSTGTSGRLTPGAATALLGVGGRLTAGKERAVVFRTSVDENAARALVFEKQGAVGWLRDKARAFELAKDPIVIPDVRDPSSLAPGDEVVTTVSGSFRAGLFIGGLPLRLGAQGVLQGDFTLGVKRLDEHRMEVVVTPASVKAIQGRVGAPWLFEGDLSHSAAAALTQGFIFDLREPGARAAYDEVFDGELPGGLPNKVKGRRREAGELVSALEAESLPDGVKRSFVDQVELKRTQGGVSVTFALWFKGSALPGLGVQSASLEERRVRLDRRGVVTTDTRGTERRRQVLLSGNENRGVYAQLARTTTYDGDGVGTSRFQDLTLTLKLSDSKVCGDELDGEVIAALNESFALDLAPMERDGRRKAREIGVSRRLDEAELARLASLASSGALTQSDEELAPLAALLEGKESPLERATAVQTFVGENGLSAMGALVRALGGAKELMVIETTSEAYSGPIAKAGELSLRYPVGISLDDDNKALSARFKAGVKALREAELGLEDLARDPLVNDEQREALRADLEQAKSSLARALSTSHLDDETCQALVTRLERGWTTGDEQRVIDHLRR